MTTFAPSQFPAFRPLPSDRERPGKIKAIEAAFGQNTSVAGAARIIGRSGFRIDPEFVLTEELLRDLTQDFPTDREELFEFDFVRSLDQAEAIRDQRLERLRREQVLGESGIFGVTASLGAAILDPGAIAIGIAATVATGPLGLGAALAEKGTRAARILNTARRGSRMRRMVRGGIIGGTSAAGAEIVIAADEDGDQTDRVLFAFGAGILGGQIGEFIPDAIRVAVGKRITRDIEFRDIMRAELANTPDATVDDVINTALTPQGRIYFKDVLSDDAQKDILESIIKASGLDEVDDADMIAKLREITPDEMRQRFANDGLDEPVPGSARVPEGSAPEVEINPSEVVPADIDELIKGTGTSSANVENLNLQLEALRLEARKIASKQAASATIVPDTALLSEFGEQAADDRLGLIVNTFLDGDVSKGVTLLNESIENPIVRQTLEEHFRRFAAGAESIRTRIADAEGFLPPKAGDIDPSKLGSSAKAVTNVKGIPRRSVSSMVGSSDVPEVRKAISAAVEDVLLRQDGTGTIESASMGVRRMHGANITTFQREYTDAFVKWKKALPPRLRVPGKSRQEFGELVGRRIKGDDSITDQNVIRAAEASADSIERSGLIGKRHNVKGFGLFELDRKYFTRIGVQRKISAAEELHGVGEVRRVLTEAIARGSSGLSDDIAARMGRAWLRRFKDGDFSVADIDLAFSGQRADILADLIRQEFAIDKLEISEEAIEQILYRVSPRARDSNVMGRARHRIRMDENTSIETDGGTLRLADLVENNAENVVTQYSREVIGSAAESSVLRAMADPGEVLESVDQLFAKLTRLGRQQGADPKRLKRDLSLLKTSFRVIRGRQLNPDADPVVAANVRRLMGLNFIRLSGAFGPAQIPELGNIIGESPTRALLAQIPALRKILASTLTRKNFDNPLLLAVERVFGLGTDRWTHRLFGRLEFEEAAGAVTTTADQLLDVTTRFAGDISTFNVVNTFERRFAGVMALQNFFEFARSGRLPSVARQEAMGLKPEQFKRIMAAVKAESGRDDGGMVIKKGLVFGKRVVDFDPDKFADQESVSLMISAISKWSRRVIQENDYGNMHPWMTKDAARLMIQFRQFHMVAWEKQFAFQAQQMDFPAFQSVSIAALLGMLVFAGQTAIRSVGRDDQEEFLEDRLSPKNLFGAAVTRSGKFSLAPGIIDSALSAGKFDSLFDFRNTGLSQRFSLDSNPSSQLFFDLARSVSEGTSQAIRPDDEVFTKGDANALRRILPFHRVMGFRQAYDFLADTENLPRRDIQR